MDSDLDLGSNLGLEIDEYEHLCMLEAKIQNQLKTIDRFIKITKKNIEKLNDYINKRYHEIKALAGRKPSRIKLMTSDNNQHMTLFFDKEFGLIPSNEDALKLHKYQQIFSKFRKKYEFKRKHWTKKDITLLFRLVEEQAKKYAIIFLIDQNLPYDLKMQKHKEIQEEKDIQYLFKQIKIYFDKRGSMADGSPTKSDTKGERKNERKSERKNERKSERKNERISKVEHTDTNTLLKTDIKIDNSFSIFLKQFWINISEEFQNVGDAMECQRVWLYYGCFEDDKQKKWNNEDLKNLLTLSKKYNERNWLSIAKELNKNISPLSCFEKYLKINKLQEQKRKVTLNRIAFNVLEDIHLQLIVSILDNKNWYEIQKYMEYLNSNNARFQMKNKLKNDENEDEQHINRSKRQIAYKRRYLLIIKDRQ
ncbi:transcription factor MYB1 [Hepatocystis sp. ex Piliocolobus tephrosceles]|nr:transcription factor MYB1 [Hepatocystis sp. ex Piliocolobus tephrosceles]